MFTYLKPKDAPVFDGLEDREVLYAKNQPEYLPLRTLISRGPDRKVISRWTLTDAQRKAITDGADIFLMLYTFGNPLQPVLMAVSDDKCEDGAPIDREWIKACLLDEPARATPSAEDSQTLGG